MTHARQSIDLDDLLEQQLRNKGKRCIGSTAFGSCGGEVTQISDQGHGLCAKHAEEARTTGIQLAVGWRIDVPSWTADGPLRCRR